MNGRKRAGASEGSAEKRIHTRSCLLGLATRTRAAFGHAGLETSTMSDDEYMSTPDPNEDDEDYRPRASPMPTIGASASPAKQQKKRGRKPNPNPSVRTAREAARKANHSVIEYVERHACVQLLWLIRLHRKKRREKINQALTELRTLVPADDTPEASPTTKDFKLEVLVRTVSHLQMLAGRVRELESAAASSASHCQCCKRERGSAYEPHSQRVELPPVSSILTGLPSPPLSGSLAVSTIMTDVPSLHLPGSSMSTISLDESPRSSPSTLRHPFHEQAAYSLLHMSARQRAASAFNAQSAETPRSILGMSPLLPARGRRI
jgi:hypothetical protein